MKKCYINAAASIHPNGSAGEDGILHALEPDYKDIITNANIRRRMSRIVKMGVACGLICLNKQPETTVNAIITATGLGCLVDTEKFLNSLIESDEQLLNPTPFIQSTFNTIGAQIALLTNNHSYNNTFVHRGLSFESALIDGMMRIYEGDNNVLIGAIDEATASLHTILKRLNLLDGIALGEGAQFFILSSNKNQNTLGSLEAVGTYTGKFSEETISEKISQFLKNNNTKASDIIHIFCGKNGNKKQDKIYNSIEKRVFASAEHHSFKNVCGEYPTASSYALIKALETGSDNEGKTLIYNNYNNINHSLILIDKC